MLNKLNGATTFESYLSCFGECNVEDPVCKDLCALRLRCTIERDQRLRMELLEDLALDDVLEVRQQ
jgi:hypothetical protein